jgi:hypothetical protein
LALTGYIPVKIGKVFPSRLVTNRLRLHKYSVPGGGDTKPAGRLPDDKSQPSDRHGWSGFFDKRIDLTAKPFSHPKRMLSL